VLSGNQTIALSRSRYYQYFENGEWHTDPGYDISRIERQNVIIEAMIAKAQSTFNPLTLQSLVASVVRDVSLDSRMSFGMVYDLANRYHAFSPSSLATWTLPTLPVKDTAVGDVEVANTDPSNDYTATIARFLGRMPGSVSTPPLDEYGDPTTMSTAPPSSTTAAPPASIKTSGSPSAVNAGHQAEASNPDYDPSVC